MRQSPAPNLRPMRRLSNPLPSHRMTQPNSQTIRRSRPATRGTPLARLPARARVHAEDFKIGREIADLVAPAEGPADRVVRRVLVDTAEIAVVPVEIVVVLAAAQAALAAGVVAGDAEVATIGVEEEAAAHEICRLRNMHRRARPIKAPRVKDRPSGVQPNTGNPLRARTIRRRPITCR
jgi:hypothetical protein